MPVRVLHAGPGYTAALCTYVPGYAMSPHAHGTVGLSVVLSGRVWERVGQTAETGGPLSVVAKPVGAVHENRFGPGGARMLAFEFDADFFDGLDEGAPAAWTWRHSDAAISRVLGLCRAAYHGDAACALDDALALLLSAPDGPTAPTAPRWLRAVRDRLHDEAPEAPSVAALAAEAGVHRVTRARAFRRHFGCAVTVYLQRLRVRSAAAALVTTDAPLAAIAFDAGFADQPHLTRAFRAALGTTPGAFRAAHA